MENKKLQVWWIRNGVTEKHRVLTVEDAIKLIKQFIKEDLEDKKFVWNAGGLEEFEDGEWTEWYNDDGEDIMEVIDNQK